MMHMHIKWNNTVVPNGAKTSSIKCKAEVRFIIIFSQVTCAFFSFSPKAYKTKSFHFLSLFFTNSHIMLIAYAS